METILEGVVGSTAYGLSTEGSDIDTLGIFATPTVDLLKLATPKETVTTVSPDGCWHEAGKYIRLSLNMNPTAYELLWLDPSLYTVMTDLGEELIDMRPVFLSATRVKEAYLGYATSQFHRLMNRDDGAFSSDTKNRTTKHARHMARLVNQGLQLYTSGHLRVHVGEDAEWYHDFSKAGKEHWIAWFEAKRVEFEDAETVLPDEPDVDAAQDWLLRVRQHYLTWK